MKTINISIPNKEYSVHVKSGILFDIDQYIDINKEIVIITDDYIPKIYLNTIMSKLQNPLVIEVPTGENSKSITTVSKVINTMIDNKITRGCLILALGGGVIGDLTGFIASIYFRGVDYIHIPTTLLSQIDSSIGGKVGINAENMKNAIGSFYQPKMVIVDPDTLQTLSQKQKNNGIAELIKYGLIADKSLFAEICDNNVWEDIEHYIIRSIEIKRDFVVDDEHDNGKRQILNFGHTIGHAIEQDSKYQLLHGEAVAIGMLAMSKNTSYYEQLVFCLEKYKLMNTYTYNTKEIFKIIQTDKKAQNKILNIILVKEVGKGFVKTINIENIKEYL
ncbi:MAG: 3-dehydroquinate synthase [Firmicutes bacterium]|nr:3-dehydroquinate synthase [Bacillota bacterium]